MTRFPTISAESEAAEVARSLCEAIEVVAGIVRTDRAW
ncbi:hypothetical protein ABIB34_000606 [Rhodococcus sp. UYP5]